MPRNIIVYIAGERNVRFNNYLRFVLLFFHVFFILIYCSFSLVHPPPLFEALQLHYLLLESRKNVTVGRACIVADLFVLGGGYTHDIMHAMVCDAMRYLLNGLFSMLV